MCRCVPDFPEADGRPDAGRIRLKERAFFVRKGRESLYFWPGGWYTTSTIVMNGNALPAVARREPPGVQCGGTALRRSPGNDAGEAGGGVRYSAEWPGLSGQAEWYRETDVSSLQGKDEAFFSSSEGG